MLEGECSAKLWAWHHLRACCQGEAHSLAAVADEQVVTIDSCSEDTLERHLCGSIANAWYLGTKLQSMFAALMALGRVILESDP